MHYAIGIDVGGSKIEGVLVDERYRILAMKRMETATNKNSSVIINQIAALAEELRKRKVAGVGVGMPGFLDNNGKVMSAPNLRALEGKPVKQLLQKKIGSRIEVENDANCFALAEHALGAGKGTRNMLGVIWGTGIGGGVIVDGRLYRGSGGAGEFGHMVIDPSGPRCACGLRGDFEAWCSGPNIVKRYRNAGGKLKNPSVTDIYYSKESVARQQMRITLEKLGTGLGNLCAAFHPEMIVLGGGVSNVTFYPAIGAAVKRHGHPALVKNVKIVKNMVGGSSGVLGAASLVLRKITLPQSGGPPRPGGSRS